jgi:hypothetical protein
MDPGGILVPTQNQVLQIFGLVLVQCRINAQVE